MSIHQLGSTQNTHKRNNQLTEFNDCQIKSFDKHIFAKLGLTQLMQMVRLDLQLGNLDTNLFCNG